MDIDTNVDIANNYPPKWRSLAVDKYPTLVTDTEGGNCFSICPISE